MFFALIPPCRAAFSAHSEMMFVFEITKIVSFLNCTSAFEKNYSSQLLKTRKVKRCAGCWRIFWPIFSQGYWAPDPNMPLPANYQPKILISEFNTLTYPWKSPCDADPWVLAQWREYEQFAIKFFGCSRPLQSRYANFNRRSFKQKEMPTCLTLDVMLKKISENQFLDLLYRQNPHI